MCEKHIDIDELDNAVKSLKHNKSPGFDGISAEFYVKYWDVLKDNLK